MGLKTYKPVTPSHRFRTSPSFDRLTKKKPEKSLIEPYHKRAGRSTGGRITVRRRGGGCKRRYRVVDFTMSKGNITGKVASIEYDPNRSAEIALIKYPDGDKRYILSPEGLKVGDKITVGENSPLTVGNSLPLKKIPVGTFIYNLQLDKNKKAQLVRAAGTYAQVLAKEENFAHIKLPSGEIRRFSLECKACIGQVGNVEHSSIRKGKAGKTRHLGRRPKVRGIAMNPIDHPLGGGEGRSSGGRHPCSPWGKLERKTRRKKDSDRLIVKRRK